MKPLQKSILIFIFSFPALSLSQDSKLTFESANKEFEKNIDNNVYKLYWNKFIKFNNENHLDEKGMGKCYRIYRGDVTIILQVNSEGVITNVVSDKNDYKAKCFISIYKGVKLPKPPFSPLYIRLIMS